MILVIDNYDSFTFNLVQYLQEFGETVLVKRNDEIALADIESLDPTAIVISPGPGGPSEAGISVSTITQFGHKAPILGVCLGHQAIGAAYGAQIILADRLMHGKTSAIHAQDGDLFKGMPKPFEACRYHSLIVDDTCLPSCLEVTAVTCEGEIMGLRHKIYPVFGVQFHPESILTTGGKILLKNFVNFAEKFRQERDATDQPLQHSESAGSLSPMKIAEPETTPTLRELIAKTIQGQNLTQNEMEAAMEVIMSGDATHTQIGAFLTALKIKGESVDEITGAATVMRRKAVQLHVDHNGSPLIDTCGTGGDCAGTFNISTTVAFILAGAGVMVAKHGNRSVSSSCGSADVLKELGADLGTAPEVVGRCIAETGFGFLFAPAFHNAMRHAAAPRQELGMRTIFNVLGPLTNPAGASCQLLGVYDPLLTEPLAYALNSLGTKSAMVVHGLDGLDEISLCGPTKVSCLKNGIVTTITLDPKELGLEYCSRLDIQGGSAEENAAHLRDVLDGKPGPRRDIALLNTAAALVVADKALDMREGMRLAAESIDSGAARAKLEAYLAFGAAE